MNETLCPNCGTKLRYPEISDKHYLRCSACQHIFKIPISPLLARTKPKKSKRLILFRTLISFSLLGIVIIGLVLLLKKTDSSISNKPKERAKWITISYDELVDKTQLTQSGEPLSNAIKTSETSIIARGAAQPFLSPYSSLLIDVLDSIHPSSGAPWVNMGYYFDPGTEQPAWAVLMRGGEAFVATNGDGQARIFLPGSDPQVAYQKYYGVVRHSLAELLPENGDPLSIEVFAFENNYERSELRLNEIPYVFSASSFPPPIGKRPLDLAGLEQFFQEDVALEGGSLSQDEGLTLYGRKSEPQTLAGRTVNISDLAVAYRAVFHAGDNAAFISLDPNIDPTKVTVNFGGFLEDTVIGSVVLESDKRFKTLCTGLDPNNFRDLRNGIRTTIPDFKTSSELEASDDLMSDQSGWVGTRFWFYPESVQVETDFAGLYARIVNAQFTADAERSRSDYADVVQFDALKKRQLSPHIKKTIDHLNENYKYYASAFPELRELLVVGRLIGLMSWLNGRSTSPIDFDALLAVPLPAFRTDRERTQLLSATTVSSMKSLEGQVFGKAIVTNLTPILETTVNGHFRDTNALATFLALRSGRQEADRNFYLTEATQLLRDYGRASVRGLIKTKDDLKALAHEAAGRTYAPEPDYILRKKNELNRLQTNMLTIKREIENLQSVMKQNADTHNIYFERHNSLVDQYNSLLVQHNSLVAEINAFDVRISKITEIGGGISLRPREFSIVKRSDSAMISEMRTRALVGMTKLPKTGQLGTWIRTRIGSSPLNVKSLKPKFKALAVNSKEVSNKILRQWTLSDLGKYWQEKGKADSSWRDQYNRNNGIQRERYFDTSDGTFHIIERSPSGKSIHIIAQKTGEDRIVFKKESQQKIIDPKTPPFWYEMPVSIRYP
jgi:hypothetical protein